MNLMELVYQLDFLHKMHIFLGVMIFTTSAFTMFLLIQMFKMNCEYRTEEKLFKAIQSASYKCVTILVVTVILSIFLPSYEAAYLMLFSYAKENNIDQETIQFILDHIKPKASFKE